MATTISVLSSDTSRPFSLGNLKAQLVSISAASGDTSATLTAPSINELIAVILPKNFVQSAAPTFSRNAATLAFAVPVSIAASAVKGGVTITADALGAGGNAITVAYTAGATAGAEVVSVIGSAISVQIEGGVSTITQVRTAINADATAAALVTATGTSATVVAVAAATALAGGITNGAQGHALLIGR